MNKLILLITFISTISFSQWLGGAAYVAKSSVPEKGAAAYIIRKLPYQGPDLGINLKGKFSYFFSGETVTIGRTRETQSFNDYSAEVFLEANFFPGMFKPFAAVGLGGGYIYTAGYNRGYFSLSGHGGLKFFERVQPFLELQVRRMFADLNSNTEITIKNLQVSGAIGILFNL
jgi:hypothetical protein